MLPSCAVGPKTYHPDKLQPPLKAIGLAALQPCSLRLHACRPEGLTDYQADHRRLDADVRQVLLSASCATLDRLLNYYLPTPKLAGKHRVVRQYGPTQTSLTRVLAGAAVSEATQAQLRAERAGLNALALRREVGRRLQEIEAARRGTAP